MYNDKLIEMFQNEFGIGNKFSYVVKQQYIKWLENKVELSVCEANSNAMLGEGWRDVRKELPVTPFLAYWTDGRITVLEEGDSVAYAITGDPEKRVIGWMPLSEIGKPAFA
jgi:hypothetical protein